MKKDSDKKKKSKKNDPRFFNDKLGENTYGEFEINNEMPNRDRRK